MSAEPSSTPSANSQAYDPATLREQMEILRREAQERARLEQEISSEHEHEVAASRKAATEAIEATEERAAKETEAARQEYDAILTKLKAQEEAERRKIDEQRKSFTTTILRSAEEHTRQITDDDQFEEGSHREVYKEKRTDPLRLFQKAEKELARTTSALEEAQKLEQIVASRGAGASAPVPAASAGSIPSGEDLLIQLEALVKHIVEQTNALEADKLAATAYSSGTRAAAITLPIGLGLIAFAAGFFLSPGDSGAGRAAGAAGEFANCLPTDDARKPHCSTSRAAKRVSTLTSLPRSAARSSCITPMPDRSQVGSATYTPAAFESDLIARNKQSRSRLARSRRT